MAIDKNHVYKLVSDANFWEDLYVPSTEWFGIEQICKLVKFFLIVIIEALIIYGSIFIIEKTLMNSINGSPS